MSVQNASPGSRSIDLCLVGNYFSTWDDMYQIACHIAPVLVAIILNPDNPGKKPDTSFDGESIRKRADKKDIFSNVQNCVIPVDAMHIAGVVC
jgi:hypothetical protein